MTIEEKRSKLAEYCKKMDCGDCPLYTKIPIFKTCLGDTDEETELNYYILFGGKEELSKDAINPSHYKQGGIECIDALKAATINLKGIDAVCTANAIKYLWRWKEKNGLEDLNKAQWYINRLIKENTNE